MTSNVTVEGSVASFVAGRDHLDSDAIAALWEAVIPAQSSVYASGLDQLHDLAATQVDSPALEFRLGAWNLDLTTGLVNSLVTSLIVAAVLQSLDYHELPGYILPTILPILLKIDAVRIARRDEAILLILREKTGEDGKPRKPAKLYEMLPKKERDAIAPSDFIAFLDRLRSAGYADVTKSDKYVVRAEGDEAVLKINIS